MIKLLLTRLNNESTIKLLQLNYELDILNNESTTIPLIF